MNTDAFKKPVISVKESAALLSITCEIPVSVRADFACNLYNEDGPLAHRHHSQRSRSRKHFCPFYLSKDEVFADEQTNNTRELSCDYVLNNKPAEMSPRSDTYTIRGEYLYISVYEVYVIVAQNSEPESKLTSFTIILKLNETLL